MAYVVLYIGRTELQTSAYTKFEGYTVHNATVHPPIIGN